jgi:hypothetical protein
MGGGEAQRARIRNDDDEFGSIDETTFLVIFVVEKTFESTGVRNCVRARGGEARPSGATRRTYRVKRVKRNHVATNDTKKSPSQRKATLKQNNSSKNHFLVAF